MHGRFIRSAGFTGTLPERGGADGIGLASQLRTDSVAAVVAVYLSWSRSRRDWCDLSRIQSIYSRGAKRTSICGGSSETVLCSTRGRVGGRTGGRGRVHRRLGGQHAETGGPGLGLFDHADADSSAPAPEVRGAKRGGVITVLSPFDFQSIDPAQISVDNEMVLADLLYRTLTTTRQTESGSLEVVGDLATDAGESSTAAARGSTRCGRGSSTRTVAGTGEGRRPRRRAGHMRRSCSSATAACSAGWPARRSTTRTTRAPTPRDRLRPESSSPTTAPSCSGSTGRNPTSRSSRDHPPRHRCPRPRTPAPTTATSRSPPGRTGSRATCAASGWCWPATRTGTRRPTPCGISTPTASTSSSASPLCRSPNG